MTPQTYMVHGTIRIFEMSQLFEDNGNDTHVELID